MQLVSLAKAAALVQIIVMRRPPRNCAVPIALLVVLGIGCEGTIATPVDATPGSGGALGTGGGVSLAGTAQLPEETHEAALLPARIRRLTDAEYQATVSSLVGSAAEGISADFVPDSRQSGFTVNEAQRVDPVFAGQLAGAARTLAADLREHAAERAPCADPAGKARACAETFIRSFGERAYRRPLGDDEVEQLLLVFGAAFDGGSYEEGIELVARAMLQSAGFLYLTEIGEAPATTIKLTPHELASSISYLIQGRPPTPELLQAAKSGELDEPAGRGTVVGKLFGPEARERVVRVIREWLGTDRIGETAKDTTVYPQFAALRPAMERETSEFLRVLVDSEGASLAQLLGADWTVADGPLAQLYGASGGEPGKFQRVTVPTRRGILNQAAFLSVFSHADGSAPVLRGVALMRRVACLPLRNPVELAISVVPPPPDPSKTTRERFDVHATDEKCATCHVKIDNFGFAFEHFDGMGQWRDTDRDKPVDSSVVITGTDFDGNYADSNELSASLSQSAMVRECFARHVFRALSGTSAAELRASEDQFVEHWKTASGGAQSVDVSIVDTLLSFVTNPSFVYRRAE